MPRQDNIYSTYQDKVSAFRFDESVANVFADMIKRSVPGYEAIITMIGVFTQAHAQADTACYDLGSSLGASTIAILANLHQPCKVIAVDNSEAMTSHCRENIALANFDKNVEVICDDIRNIEFQAASVIVLNFTLQFIPENDRLPLLKKISNALMPGGILIMSEKIYFEDNKLNQEYTELHHAFKKAQGYSDLEISQKRTALENVLIPETESTHIARFKQAGFNQSQMWFRCLNFASFYAIK